MLPLPKDYKPLTTEERKAQADRLEAANRDAEKRHWHFQTLAETVKHEGDKRTCPACKLGIPDSYYDV